MSLEHLLEMQKQLMEKVPHEVKPQALAKMEASVKILDTLLRFLNSTGHKPWRPIPLSPTVQQGLMKELEDKVGFLDYIHKMNAGVGQDFSSKALHSRQLISAFGIVEETVEYLNSIPIATRAEQLEEITDILFFYLELVILGGFTWQEIEEEYVRKHAVNLERYRRAKEGDYQWNHRGEEKGL